MPSRPLQVQGYVSSTSAKLASTLPLSRLCWSCLPTSLLPFYPQCLHSMGTSDQDTAMHCHFHQHQRTQGNPGREGFSPVRKRQQNQPQPGVSLGLRAMQN